MRKIAIIGSGTWGLALASYLANQGNDVKVWSFAKEEVEMIQNERRCKFFRFNRRGFSNIVKRYKKEKRKSKSRTRAG